MDSDEMTLSEKFSKKWKSLNRLERTAICVLAIFVMGVIIFTLGTNIGEAFYRAFSG